jgi:DNA-binding MarR family transcriptional regulator
VKITDKGRKTTKEFKCIIENIENEIFEKYNDKEKEKLKIMLRDIAKEYDNLT